MQVKARASPAVLADYVGQLRPYGADRIVFVCPAPSAKLAATPAPEGVELWLSDTLARKAVTAGLFDWLIDRVR